MEEELNQLMSEKKKNDTIAKTAFEERLKDTKQKAIDENIKNAEKTGNTLTQTIDKEGNLIGINNVNTQEKTLSENDNLSVSDICRELFEGDHIVMGKTDNGLSQLVSGPFSKKND
jgi:ribosomal protein L18